MLSGASIDQQVMKAYAYLINYYQDRDRIFLFGFSRGAYLVCGLLDYFGLLRPGNEGEIQHIWTAYKYMHKAKDKEDKADAYREIFGREVRVHFLGIFDTVCSVTDGILPRFSERYFMNTRTLNVVDHVRHALAFDERRVRFQYVSLRHNDKKIKTLIQQWFPGDHGDVGGGYESDSSYGKELASDIPLQWMLDEAIKFELKVKKSRLFTKEHLIRAQEAPLHDSLRFSRKPLGGKLETYAWWFIEMCIPWERYMPVFYEDEDVYLGNFPNMGNYRPIDFSDGSLFHPSVEQRCRADSKYKRRYEARKAAFEEWCKEIAFVTHKRYRELIERGERVSYCKIEYCALFHRAQKYSLATS